MVGLGQQLHQMVNFFPKRKIKEYLFSLSGFIFYFFMLSFVPYDVFQFTLYSLTITHHDLLFYFFIFFLTLLVDTRFY